MRQKFVIGNWKMHTTTVEASHLARAIAAGMSTDESVIRAVCSPFPDLTLLGEVHKSSRIALGAQNLYPAKEGAFTGVDGLSHQRKLKGGS